MSDTVTRFQTSLYSRRHTYCGSEDLPHQWGGISPWQGDHCYRCGAVYELTGVSWHEVHPDLPRLKQATDAPV